MDNTNYTTERRKGQHHQERDQARNRVALQRQVSALQGGRGQESVFGATPKQPQAVPLSVIRSVPSIRCEAFQGRREMVLGCCYGEAIRSGEFSRAEMVCTKTLYNYVDLGLLPIKKHRPAGETPPQYKDEKVPSEQEKSRSKH